MCAMLQVDVVDVGHRIKVPLKQQILIGRGDASANVFPEVDLTPYAAIEKGVSRHHAKITRQDDKLVIEDVGSVNGTFHNGHRLTPYQAVPLSSGDVVQLGTLVLQVDFDLPGSTEAEPRQQRTGDVGEMDSAITT